MSIYRYLEKHRNLLDQLPGLVCLHDQNSKLAYANQHAANLLGYSSAEQCIDIDYADLKCDAAKDHLEFKKQDSFVFKKKACFDFLSYHPYSDDWKLVIGKKSPLLDESGTLLGLISTWSDISDYRLIDLSRFLINSQRSFNSMRQKPFCMSIIPPGQDKFNLNSKQLNCLFFLIRGKTAKDIASILNLSFRTIEAYINQMKEIMDCKSKSELIEKAIVENYLTYLPSSLLE